MLYFIIAISAIVFLIHIMLRYLDSLQMFQQNVYDTNRYFAWCVNHTEKIIPILLILPLILWLGIYFYPSLLTLNILLGLTTLFFTVQSVFIWLRQRKFVKKPLVMTPRAWRLTATSGIIIILLIVSAYFISLDTQLKYIFIVYLCLLLNIFIYSIVWIANILNTPIEKNIKTKFINEAKVKISNMQPQLQVVGITGSYGKTTTKHIVNHILNESFYSLMTPASFNTPMGITITIREHLKPIHDIFVCEMGAYKVGEIKELSDIAKPKYGVLTAIGPQHLNTFKSLENIQKTKFELIESLDEAGLAILNMDDPMIRAYEIKSPCRKVMYSTEDPNADYFATNISYTDKGISFDVILPTKESHHIETMLLGEHNIQNILAAIAIATDMGMEPVKMIKAIKSLPQIEHRLEIKPAGNFTIIDDAFNANPVGTKKAIDVLTKMAGKKIVITPGMIELGAEEEKLNEEYGAYMADKVDFVILVGKKQTEPIYRGLRTKLPEEKIFVAANLTEGFERMYSEAIADSFVLIANDLPDTYNEN